MLGEGVKKVRVTENSEKKDGESRLSGVNEKQ